jgi:hypothetical protein
MKQGACYIRVSTDDQLEYSPDAQLREIQKYAKSNDILISKEHIFIDEGITGRSAKKRPGFNKMIGTAKQDPRPFDVILLWKFSQEIRKNPSFTNRCSGAREWRLSASRSLLQKARSALSSNGSSNGWMNITPSGFPAK